MASKPEVIQKFTTIMTSQLYNWTKRMDTDDFNKRSIGSLDDLITYIKNNEYSSGYEVLNGNVVPYYDYDIDYVNHNDQLSNRVKDYLIVENSIKEKFPNAKIYIFSTCGFNENTNLYRNSFHAIVRGAGYYSCGNNVPLIFSEHCCDILVYKDVGKDQRFRMVYKDKDGDGRFLKRCYVKDNQLIQLSIDEIGTIGETIDKYIIQNISGEVFVNNIDLIDMKKLLGSSKWKNITYDYNMYGKKNYVQMLMNNYKIKV